MEAPEIIESSEKRIQSTDWNTIDNAVNWLRENQKSDSPFMLYIGLNAPHPRFVTSRYYYDLIAEEDVNIPPKEEEHHPVMEYQRIQKNWTHGFSDEMIRKVRHIYFAMIAEVDAMLGAVLDELEALNLKDSTYIIFTSDHGEMAMEHEQFYKMSLYEPSVRVPLIIRGPGLEKDKSIDTLTSLVDIYPTLMDMAEVEYPLNLDGHSLVPELKGKKADRPDWVLAEFHGSTCNTGCFMFRQGDYKYNVYVGYKPQLFNVKEDPFEINNLVDKRPDIAREMDERLRNTVDYEAVDAKVKAYDKESFKKWREIQKRAGTYEENMALVHSGWDGITNAEAASWTEQDEKQIIDWLNNG